MQPLLSAFKTCLGLCLLLALPVFAAEERPMVIDAAALMEAARIDAAALAKMSAGEVIILRSVADTKGDSNTFNIYTGVATIIDASADVVTDVLLRPEWAGAGIPGAVGTVIAEDADFPLAEFGAADQAEVRRILKGKDLVNLSRAELDGLRALKVSEPYDADELNRFSAAYTDLLRARYTSYLEKGLDGIAPYELGKKKWSPAEHILLINEFWDPWLPQVLPLFAQHLPLSQAPAELDPLLKQGFLLVKKPVGKRPIFSLVHRIGRHTDEFLTAVHREYFVSGAYGAMQIVMMGVPHEGKTLMLVGGDAFTEQVAGFASGTKHKVGQGMMRDIMSGMLLELRVQAAQTVQTVQTNRLD